MPGATEALYVDAKRTHEVRVSLERAGTLDFVVRESELGNRAPEDVYTERRVITEPWETKMLQLRLETRLALLGSYYRAVPGGWAPVRPAQAGRPIELAPLALDEGARVVEFHHFTGREKHAVTLIGVHQGEGKERRSMLARLDYSFPETDGGNLQIVHTRLPAPVYRSALASQHLELRELRFEKLPPNADTMVDPRTWAALRAALDAILGRLAESAAVKSAAFDGILVNRADITSMVALHETKRRAKGAASAARTYDVEFELGPGAAPVEGKKAEVTIEQLSPDVMQALRDPKLGALTSRFLPPGEDARLIEVGERAIAMAMRKLRDERRPDEQHLVSILEAALLLRHAFAKRVRVDPDVITRVKHAAAYL